MSPAAPPAPHETAAPDRVALGVAWMAAFALLAPMLDVFAKLAAASVPVAVIALSRFSVQAALLGAVALIGRRPPPPRRELPWHALRGVLVAAATLLFFAALRHLPLADAIGIFFVEPLLLTVLSALLLGERVGWRRWAACLAGFGGVMLIVRPNFAAAGAPALWPLGTALLFALYLILTRRLSPRSDPVTMQLVAGLSGGAATALAIGVGALAGAEGAFAARWPPAADWPLLLGVGAFSTAAHLCVVISLRHAPASAVAPVQYLEIAAAALYGWWVFGDAPGPAALAGMALVTAAGLYVLRREARAGA